MTTPPTNSTQPSSSMKNIKEKQTSLNNACDKKARAIHSSYFIWNEVDFTAAYSNIYLVIIFLIGMRFISLKQIQT